MIELKAKKRDIFGKKLCYSREAGELPVVVYGADEKPSHLFVNSKDFLSVWKQAGESSVVKLSAGDLKKDVLIQDVSFHAVSGEPLHADFYLVRADQLIRVYIPLRFEGVAPAAKTFGGVLVKVMHEVEVEALPADLPHEFVVDVSKIEKLEDQITVSDLKVPSKVKIIAAIEDVVALVSVGKEEVEEVAGPVDLSKIEVEKKGKKLEEGEDVASAKAPQAAASTAKPAKK
ncbi:MAG: 50S ribosomal protein L25 [Candidatus Vogelbacteria bacterium]|nr:50S ribosomal protein L25 [Candidatus Vogelbacteria bacterium]